MKTIELADSVHEKIALLALAWRVGEGEVVERLLTEFTSRGRHSDSPDPDGVPVHAIYENARVDAVFHETRGDVTITSGALAGQSFRSPSGAAIAIVAHLNPRVSPNRNGWDFFIVTATGQPLRSLRRSRTR